MLTEQDILNKLKDVLSETFEIDPERVTLQARLYEDLDIDSIDAVDLIVQLRPLIGDDKKISPAQFKQVRTVEDLIGVLSDIISD